MKRTPVIGADTCVVLYVADLRSGSGGQRRSAVRTLSDPVTHGDAGHKLLAYAGNGSTSLICKPRGRALKVFKMPAA